MRLSAEDKAMIDNFKELLTELSSELEKASKDEDSPQDEQCPGCKEDASDSEKEVYTVFSGKGGVTTEFNNFKQWVNETFSEVEKVQNRNARSMNAVYASQSDAMDKLKKGILLLDKRLRFLEESPHPAIDLTFRSPEYFKKEAE